jgi:hypothetical protein
MSDPFFQLIRRKNEDLRELELFVDIALNGLDMATKAVRGVELVQEISKVLGEPSPYPTLDVLERAKARAQAVEKFAAQEKQRGFPYLFGLGSVRLWALMEALVDELVIEALKTPKQCKDQALLAKLKGPLLEFRGASIEDQAEFLAETLKQAVDATLKQGVGKFEAVLEPVGLGGGVADAVRKLLFELSNVRNAIVHRGGKADRRLVESCPWLGLSRGNPLLLTGRHFHRYVLSAQWYLLELRARHDFPVGKTRSTELEHLQTELLKLIAKDDQDPANARKAEA